MKLEAKMVHVPAVKPQRLSDLPIWTSAAEAVLDKEEEGDDAS